MSRPGHWWNDDWLVFRIQVFIMIAAVALGILWGCLR